MTSARLLAACLALPLAAFAQVESTDGLSPSKRMSDDELSQVHAAGLPAHALQDMAQGLPLALVELPAPALNAQDLHSQVDRQQAMSQIRLAQAATQGSIGLMQTGVLPALFTPVAPLFIPVLAMPFPFLMTPPPKKAEPGH
jgi:hypothetical protein